MSKSNKKKPNLEIKVEDSQGKIKIDSELNKGKNQILPEYGFNGTQSIELYININKFV